MYCVTMFWWRDIYNPISSRLTLLCAAPLDGYTHVPSNWRFGPMPAIRRSARWWNPSRYLSIQGSRTTSMTQTGALLAPLPHRTSLPTVILYAPSLPKIFVGCYHLPWSLRMFHPTASQSLSVDDNSRPKYQNKQTVVSGVPYAIRPAPSDPPYPQPETSFASSPPNDGTSLRPDILDWGPPVEKTCHTGDTRGEVDSPPPVWRCFTKDLGRQIGTGGLSVRTLSLAPLHRSPQSVKVILKWHPILCGCPFPIPTPPPPYWGKWVGLAAPNSMLMPLIGRNQPGHQVDSALRAMDHLAEYLSIGKPLNRH